MCFVDIVSVNQMNEIWKPLLFMEKVVLFAVFVYVCLFGKCWIEKNFWKNQSDTWFFKMFKKKGSWLVSIPSNNDLGFVIL